MEETYLALAQLPGQLAIGSGPDLKVARPDGGTEQEIDGPGTQGGVVAYQPVWSGDGTKLAWGRRRGPNQSIEVLAFDDEGQPEEERLSSAAPPNPIYYLQWNGDDERLLSLRTPEDGDQVEFGVVTPGRPLEPVATGQPFFLSWAPESNRVLAHVDGTTLRLYGAGEAEQTIGAVSEGFSAPVWVDEDRAVVAVDGFLSIVDVATGAVTPVVAAADPVRFVLSPDRTKVAYQTMGPNSGAMTVGWAQGGLSDGLRVLDLATNEIELVAPDGGLAWEWSPDSQRLAWLTPTGRDQFRWNFWGAESAPVFTSSTQSFALTEKFGSTYLPFFAQYAQSVTGWSPDSSAFAFAVRNGVDEAILVQLVDVNASSVMVGEGDFVTWGPGPTPPPPAGGISPI